MTEQANNQDTGAAIDGEELAAMAAELEQDEAPESAGELVEQAEGPPTAEIIQPIIDLACGVMAPNWHIQKGERQAMAEAYGDLLDKYFPEGLGDYGVELNALLCTAAVLGPRVAKRIPPREPPKKPEKDHQEQEEQPHDEG